MNIKIFLLLIIILLAGKRSTFGQDLSALYEKVNPAVVTITVTSEEIVGTGARRQTATVQGLGSGFMISEKQLITAAHVVQNAESIRIEFTTSEKIPGKVISIYKNADVALVELAFTPKNPVSVPIGDSDAMKIGEQIFVIGAPFGLEHSLSSGYISGKLGSDRKVSSAFTKLEFFQTDASINHGNSGGPMFNMKGEVIGVVSYILSQSGGFEGLGFAATSNVAKQLLLDRNPNYLGIDGVPISGNLAKFFNLPQPEAFLVEKVVFLSPAGMMGVKGGAYKAKIEDLDIILGGDFILAIDGIKFSQSNLEALSSRMNQLKSGEPFTLTILREGKIKILTGDFH